MQYKVLYTLTQPQGRVSCEIDASIPAGVGTEFRGAVTGEIELTNTGSAISARGRLYATAVLECSRCLARHTVDLDVQVNEECSLSQIEELTSGKVDESQPIPILDANMVDLTELVRQVLALNVPPRSLCRPDCKGLCPQCGKDLNGGPCACPDVSDDSPWAALRDLPVKQ